MKVYNLEILSLVYRYNDINEYPTDIVKNHTRDEWNKLISETKNHLLYYKENDYGLNVTSVDKKNFFLRITYKINKNKFKKNPPDFIIDELNSYLNAGGFPSFYTDNLKNKKRIDRFVYHNLY